jgi:hypothetical protein
MRERGRYRVPSVRVRGSFERQRSQGCGRQGAAISVRLCNQASNSDVKLCTKFERLARAIETLLETSLEDGNNLRKLDIFIFLFLRCANATLRRRRFLSWMLTIFTSRTDSRSDAVHYIWSYRK